MLLNLEVNITAGSLTSCPGRCFLALAVTSSCARRTAGGDVLSTRSTGIFVVVVKVQLLPRWCRAATAALLAALVQHGCYGRSGSFNALQMMSASAEATARSAASSVRALACLQACKLTLHPLFTLASVLRAASSKF